MKRHSPALLLVSTVMLALPGWASAAPAARRTIPRQQAVRTALAGVPGGRIGSAELEREGGRLVWSFDISRPGFVDVTEIQVDAHSGAIVSRKTESPTQERKEMRIEHG